MDGMENPSLDGWFRGTPIYGNLHLIYQPLRAIFGENCAVKKKQFQIFFESYIGYLYTDEQKSTYPWFMRLGNSVFVAPHGSPWLVLGLWWIMDAPTGPLSDPNRYPPSTVASHPPWRRSGTIVKSFPTIVYRCFILMVISQQSRSYISLQRTA